MERLEKTLRVLLTISCPTSVRFGLGIYQLTVLFKVAVGKLPVLTVYGDKFDTKDGTGVRDYIHVVDLAKGHVKALERIEQKGHIGTEIYNLGTGTGYSVLEMVAALEKASGRKVPIKVGTLETTSLFIFLIEFEFYF